MSHYVLIHGSWHGSWCWKLLLPYLHAQGHTTECVDFPGYNTLPSKVSYDDYYSYLKGVLLVHDEPVVLVSHSMSGIIAGPIAHDFPERVKHSFYIGAYLPRPGESLLDVALSYDDSEIPSILEIDEVNKLHKLDLSGAATVLYHDCDSEVQAWAVRQLRAQPYEPLETPLSWKITPSVKDISTYIICENDRDVSVCAQRDMSARSASRVISMESGHFPFLSQPELLSEVLLDL